MIGFAIGAALIGVVAAFYISSPLAKSATTPWVRLGALGLAGLIAFASLGLYTINASPSLPGVPYQQRMAELKQRDPSELTALEQIELIRDRLRREGPDAEAYALLGRLLARQNPNLEAVTAFQNSLREEIDPLVLSDLGQTLVNMNEGEVTPEARQVFQEAYDIDSALPEPAFFLGLYAYQDGDREAAYQQWLDVVQALNADNPFRTAILARAVDLLSRPNAGPVDLEAGGAAPFAQGGGDPEAMIEGMISRLEARLNDNPDNLSDWMVLIRAEATRDNRDEAREHWLNAWDHYQGDDQARLMLHALGRALSMTMDGEAP